MIDFTGKTAIVTGGTRGIGKAIVDLLLESGCEVVYTGTKQRIEDGCPAGRYEPLDLSDHESIDRFASRVVESLPSIEVLVNNAGINTIESIDEISDENWEKIISVNLTGTMRLLRETSRVMKKAGTRGKILNISSIFGVVSKAKRNSYSASKTGLIGLTRATALDLAPYDIMVNALCPGFTKTELTFSVLPEEELKALSSEVPLGRFAEPSEIAETAVFLCSDWNSYMTGQVVIVDGGFTTK